MNVDLVMKCMDSLKKSKASGLDGLMAEHLFYVHPVLSVHLSFLFTIIFSYNLILYLMPLDIVL